MWKESLQTPKNITDYWSSSRTLASSLFWSRKMISSNSNKMTKYLRIKLLRKLQITHEESYTILRKGSNVRPKKWRFPVSMKRLNTRGANSHHWLFNVNTVLPLGFVVELDKILHVFQSQVQLLVHTKHPFYGISERIQGNNFKTKCFEGKFTLLN